MPYFKFGDLIRDIKNGRYKDAFEAGFGFALIGGFAAIGYGLRCVGM